MREKICESFETKDGKILIHKDYFWVVDRNNQLHSHCDNGPKDRFVLTYGVSPYPKAGEYYFSSKETAIKYIKLIENNMIESNEPSKFEKIYSSLLNMQEAKDKAYGNSALKPLDIFAKHHNYGSRLDEKLARVKNCDELRKNDVADLIGGLILICRDKGWDNFDDLID